MEAQTSNGIPSAKRGRKSGSNVDFSEFEAYLEVAKENLDQAYGFENCKPSLATALKRAYGVNTAMRNVDPNNKNIGTLWFQWPSYEDNEGNLVLDEEAIAENIEG